MTTASTPRPTSLIERWARLEEREFADAFCERAAVDRFGERRTIAALWTDVSEAQLLPGIHQLLAAAILPGEQYDLAVDEVEGHRVLLISVPARTPIPQDPMAILYRGAAALRLRPADLDELLQLCPALEKALRRWERRQGLRWSLDTPLSKPPKQGWQEQKDRWRNHSTPYGGSWRCEDLGPIGLLIEGAAEQIGSSGWMLQPALHDMTVVERLAAPPLTPVTGEEAVSTIVDPETGALLVDLREVGLAHGRYAGQQQRGAELDSFTKEYGRRIIDYLSTTMITRVAQRRGIGIIHLTPAMPPRPEGVSVAEWKATYAECLIKITGSNYCLDKIRQEEGVRLHRIAFSDEPTAGRNYRGWWTKHILLISERELDEDHADRIMDRIEKEWVAAVEQKLGPVDQEAFDYRLADVRWWVDPKTGAPYSDTCYFFKNTDVHDDGTPTVVELRMRRAALQEQIDSYADSAEVQTSTWKELYRINDCIEILDQYRLRMRKVELPRALQPFKQILSVAEQVTELGRSLLDRLQAGARRGYRAPVLELPASLWRQPEMQISDVIAVAEPVEQIAVGQAAGSPRGAAQADIAMCEASGSQVCLVVVQGGVEVVPPGSETHTSRRSNRLGNPSDTPSDNRIHTGFRVFTTSGQEGLDSASGVRCATGRHGPDPVLRVRTAGGEVISDALMCHLRAELGRRTLTLVVGPDRVSTGIWERRWPVPDHETSLSSENWSAEAA